MNFLRSPLTWILLAAGIWLNCGYNYRVMQTQGVDAVTTPMLLQQALMGSAILVGFVCGLALLRGEKFELYNQSDPGKINYAALIIGGVLVCGFVFNFILNRDLLFITQGGALSAGGNDERSNGNTVRRPVDDHGDYGRLGDRDAGLARRARVGASEYGWDRRVQARQDGAGAQSRKARPAVSRVLKFYPDGLPPVANRVRPQRLIQRPF